jgi:hypothetical protein
MTAGQAAAPANPSKTLRRDIKLFRRDNRGPAAASGIRSNFQKARRTLSGAASHYDKGWN